MHGQNASRETKTLRPPPQDIGPKWRYVPLGRNEDDIRQPPIRQPGGFSPDDRRRKDSEAVWNGAELSWEQLTTLINDGAMVNGMACREVGIFPAVSGLVILDCDVKFFYADGFGTFATDGEHADMMRCFKLSDGTPRVQVTEKHGIDQLRNVVERLGHEFSELDTYTVQTKSNGLHLYFAENPRYPLRTTGHRDEWYVDVIAHNAGSDRSWAAAPPTPGYRVVADVPVIEMPDWLALWLLGLRDHTLPLGGARRVRLNAARRTALSEAQLTAWVPGERGDSLSELLRRYKQFVLATVALSNQVSGWNRAIYQAACDLCGLGHTPEEVTSALLQAAQPWDDRERRKAEATIRSAINKKCW